jgi:hypothetical protein
MIPDPPADGDLLLLGYNIADQANFRSLPMEVNPLLLYGQRRRRGLLE